MPKLRVVISEASVGVEESFDPGVEGMVGPLAGGHGWRAPARDALTEAADLGVVDGGVSVDPRGRGGFLYRS